MLPTSTMYVRDPNSKALVINDDAGLARRKAQLTNNELEDKVRRLENDIIELKAVLLKKLNALECVTHVE